MHEPPKHVGVNAPVIRHADRNIRIEIFFRKKLACFPQSAGIICLKIRVNKLDDSSIFRDRLGNNSPAS